MIAPAALKEAFELLRRNGLSWRDLAAYAIVRTGPDQTIDETVDEIISGAHEAACDVAGFVGNYFEAAVEDRRNDK